MRLFMSLRTFLCRFTPTHGNTRKHSIGDVVKASLCVQIGAALGSELHTDCAKRKPRSCGAFVLAEILQSLNYPSSKNVISGGPTTPVALILSCSSGFEKNVMNASLDGALLPSDRSYRVRTQPSRRRSLELGMKVLR